MPGYADTAQKLAVPTGPILGDEEAEDVGPTEC